MEYAERLAKIKEEVKDTLYDIFKDIDKCHEGLGLFDMFTLYDKASKTMLEESPYPENLRRTISFYHPSSSIENEKQMNFAWKFPNHPGCGIFVGVEIEPIKKAISKDEDKIVGYNLNISKDNMQFIGTNPNDYDLIIDDFRTYLETVQKLALEKQKDEVDLDR